MLRVQTNCGSLHGPHVNSILFSSHAPKPRSVHFILVSTLETIICINDSFVVFCCLQQRSSQSLLWELWAWSRNLLLKVKWISQHILIIWHLWGQAVLILLPDHSVYRSKTIRLSKLHAAHVHWSATVADRKTENGMEWNGNRCGQHLLLFLLCGQP